MVHRDRTPRRDRDAREPKIRRRGEHIIRSSKKEKRVVGSAVGAAFLIAVAVFILLYLHGG